MSLKDKASLIFKPSRYKSGKVYSYRGEDFTFTRSSVATRINSEGNLEEVASGIPRLNYNRTDLTKCPTLLLEPAKTNTIPYYKYESGSGFNLGSNITWNGFVKSPEGVNNASRFTSSLASASYVQPVGVTIPAGDFTFSMWVRGVEGTFSNTSMYIPSHTGTYATMNETPSAGEDWKLVYGSGTNTSGSSYARNITLPFYDQPPGAVWEMYGFQLEEGIYPTSLVKTNGASASRSSDQSKTPYNLIAGLTEATLVVEYEQPIEQPTGYNHIAGYRDNSNADFYILQLPNSNNHELRWRGQNGTAVSLLAAFYGLHRKIAFVKTNDKLIAYCNGVKVGETSASGTNAFSTNASEELDLWYTGFVESNFIEELLLFPAALNESELIAITSYDDYQELVDRNELTWESPTITNNRLTALKEL